MRWGRLALCCLLVASPAAAVGACSGPEREPGNPRIDNPPPPDAEDVEAEAAPRPRFDAGLDGGDADALEAAAPPPPVTLSTGSGETPDPQLGYGDHTCVIDRATRVLACWGANDHGQLGIGTTGDGTTLADVSRATVIAEDENGLPFTGIDEVSLSAWHSCARKGDVLFCWGERLTGAQAEPPLTPNLDRTRPRAIGNLEVRTASAGGPHTCAARTMGDLTCFGHASLGELNRGDAGEVPCTAPFFRDYLVDGGEDAGHTCSGGLRAAVDAPEAGVLSLSLGEVSSCAMTAGRVICWGANEDGQLGRVTVTPFTARAGAVAVDGVGTALDGVTRLAAGGGRHACALRAGQVLCWGRNDRGQLGFDPAVVPTRAFAAAVPGLAGVTEIGVADGVSCAVRADKTVVCWGADLAALGDGGVAASHVPSPVKGPLGVGLLGEVIAVAPGARHACALRSDKVVVCWGKNDRGQLGDGTLTDSAFPVKVLGLEK